MLPSENFSDLIRFVKSIKTIRFPFIIDCKHIRIKSLLKVPKRVYFDTGILLDIILVRWCKDGYPLWWSSSIIFSKCLKGEYTGCFSNFSLDQIRGVISRSFEHKNNEFGRKKLEKIIELRKLFKFANLTEEEKDNSLVYSKDYKISIEDAIHIYASEKINADTFVTRDKVLLKHVELNKKFQFVQPEALTGKPPRNLYLNVKYLDMQPERLIEQLEKRFKEFI